MNKEIKDLVTTARAAEKRIEWIQEELSKTNMDITFKRWVDELENYIEFIKSEVEDLEEKLEA